MGGGRKKAPWQSDSLSDYYATDYQQGGRGKAWRVWPGAWPSPQRSEQPARYDQMDVSEDHKYKGNWLTATADGSQGPSSTAPSRTQLIQKELTASRKAEARLRRIKDERSLREKQWQKFKEKTKQDFIKQQKQFEADLERLDQEAFQVAEQGELAAARVQAIVNSTALPATASTAPPDDSAWEQLLQDDEEVPDATAFQQAMMAVQYLRRQGTLQTRSAPMQVDNTEARGTAAPGAPGPPGLGPYFQADPRHANTGADRIPFLPSPSTRLGEAGQRESMETKTAPPTAVPATAPIPPQQTAVPMQPVHLNPPPETNALSPPQVLLAEKLGNKRREARAAMQPFGGTMQRPAPEGAPPGDGPKPGIVDDDNGDLDAAQPLQTEANLQDLG